MASPNTLAIRQPRDYTKTGKPTQKHLTRLIGALPRLQDFLREHPGSHGGGSKRVGMGRAKLRAYIRFEDAKREPSAPNARKRLPRQAWRLHKALFAQRAFRRFNPEGLASNQQEQREAA